METYFPWIVTILLTLIWLAIIGVIQAINHLATFIMQVEDAVRDPNNTDSDLGDS